MVGEPLQARRIGRYTAPVSYPGDYLPEPRCKQTRVTPKMPFEGVSVERSYLVRSRMGRESRAAIVRLYESSARGSP